MDASAWLVTWGEAVGKGEIESILQQQNVDGDEKYAQVLDQIK